jgi:hypothetical protein
VSPDRAGVGLCLGTAGAVIAVVREYPMRLAGAAAVTWPAQLWRPEAPPQAAMSAGRRGLARARRRLGLPRWCPVAVVAGPSLSAGAAPEWVAPRAAQLLGRAALAQGWVIVADRAAALRAGSHLAVAAELAAAAAGAEAQLAAGAAIAALLPPVPGWVGAAAPARYAARVAPVAPAVGTGRRGIEPDAAGFDRAGFDRAGFDAAGFDAAGFDRAGFDAAGFDAAGSDRAGFDAAGFDAAGFDRAGFDGAAGWAVQRAGDRADPPRRNRP